jgi:hypothetical protein
VPFVVLDPSTAAAAPAITFGAPLTSTGDTLADMQDELMLMIANRNVPPARTARWINVAYRRVCASLDLDMMEGSYAFSTVANQPFYLMPAGVSFVRNLSVIDASGFPISEGSVLDKMDLMTYRRLPDSTNQMFLSLERYFRYNNMLVLYPTPPSAFTVAVDVRIKPQPLVDPTDSPFIPEEFHESVLLLSRQIAFSRLLEFDKAAVAQNEYVDSVRDKEDTKSKEETGRVIRSSYPRRGRSITSTGRRASYNQLLDML